MPPGRDPRRLRLRAGVLLDARQEDVLGALIGFTRLVDGLSDRIGHAVRWLLLAAVLVSTANAVTRKVFNVGSNAYLEAQWYLFATVFMLGAGYVLLHDQHIRIDVLSSRWRRRTQVWVDVFGLALCVIPMCVVIGWMALPSIQSAIATREVSANPGGLLRWPLYLLVPLGFALLALQATSELVKRVLFLAGRGPDPHPPKGGEPAAPGAPAAAGAPSAATRAQESRP